MEREEYIGQYTDDYRPRRNKAYYRKKRRIRRLIIITVITAILLLGLITFLLFRSQNGVMKGTWVYDQYTKYEFDGKENGCMCLEELHYEFTYSVKGDTLKMDFEDPSVHDCEYTFTIDSDRLTLVGGEGTNGGTYQLTKE